MYQKTIKNKIEFSGTGLHTGVDVNVCILPAEADTGIRFVREDFSGFPEIEATYKNVVSTSFATTIGVNGATVSTVEHLMAAFYGLGINNAVVRLDGPEVPVMDGSAREFVNLIEDAGIAVLNVPRKYMVITKPVKIVDGNKYAYLLPLKDNELDGGAIISKFSINFSIDFDHPCLSKQSFSLISSRKAFKEEISAARTFGFLKDVETLRENGLARGGSLANAVVIGEKDILNEEGLRFPDEFVRHKILDVFGDLALMGAPIIGRLEAHRSGHALNFSLVEKLFANPNRWELKELHDHDSEVQEVARVFSEEFATA
jgi:UDP-3-O-[3-hydroxymyristoyl] N-acetylglucosamine deacetylase